MGFNLIYWTPMGGSYFLLGSNLEKYGKQPFFQADMAGSGKYHTADLAGLGSIGLKILPSSHSTATWCIMVNVSMWCLPTTAHKE